MALGLGHLDIIASVPISGIATHNQTSCNSPEKIFPSSEHIWENLHLGKLTCYHIAGFLCRVLIFIFSWDITILWKLIPIKVSEMNVHMCCSTSCTYNFQYNCQLLSDRRALHRLQHPIHLCRHGILVATMEETENKVVSMNSLHTNKQLYVATYAQVLLNYNHLSSRT